MTAWGYTLPACMYALSAGWFRWARFIWLAVLLIFAPWTILTNLGWFTLYRPPVPGFALSWAVLAWFLYPAFVLLPVWNVYLLAWLLPTARHEHYGLMLLAFGPLGLIAAQLLKRIAPRPEIAQDYALPGYLMGYGSVIVGTMLVAHDIPLLALTLLYDALLLIISARLFRNPLWIHLAGAIVPVSLLRALHEAGVPGSRQGWWLIGLASIYLTLAWALRRVNLAEYGVATLTIGFALIALGLLPSSQDQTGALCRVMARRCYFTQYMQLACKNRL